MVKIWQMLFGFFPAWFQVFVLAVLAFIVVIIVFKIVAFILDCIPFA